MRILAIDFGERRVGLAISDPDGRLALPLTSLDRTSDAALVDELARIAASESVGRFVIGEPRRLDGSRGSAARRVASFAEKLRRATGLPYRLVDEALTTREAVSRLRAAGVDPRKVPASVDSTAALVLLEEELARESLRR